MRKGIKKEAHLVSFPAYESLRKLEAYQVGSIKSLFSYGKRILQIHRHDDQREQDNPHEAFNEQQHMLRPPNSDFNHSTASQILSNR